MKHYFISGLASFTNPQRNSFLEKLSWSHVCAQGYINNLILLFAPLHQFEIAGPNHLTAWQLETSMESITWESQFRSVDFRYEIPKVKEQKPDCSGGPDHLIMSIMWSQEAKGSNIDSGS